MIFNPVIIVAIIVQSWVAKASRVAGAIMGFLITTGIFLWGLAVYGSHNQIMFFGIPLSQPVFVILCLVWYVFDTFSLIAALKPVPVAAQPVPGTPAATTDAATQAALPATDSTAPRVDGDTINFGCTECGKPISFKKRHAGLVIRCPECNERVIVPDLS